MLQVSTATLDQALQRAWQFQQACRFPEAEALCRQILAAGQNLPEPWFLLGSVLLQTARPADAVDPLRRAVALRQNFPEAWHDLGDALQLTGMLDESIAAFRQAIALRPNFPQALNGLGCVLLFVGKFPDAAAAFQQALRCDPTLFPAWNNLGNVLKDVGRLEDAATAYQEALRLQPRHAGCRGNLAAILLMTGRAALAVEAYRQAHRDDPGDLNAHTGLLLSLHSIPDADPGILFDEHRRWNQEHAMSLQAAQRPHLNSRDPDRPLRIGYVSADFREHPVAFFLEPLLERHDRSRFQIFCYSNCHRTDHVTTRLQKLVPDWRHIPALSDDQAAELVRQDQIDILVDLAGQTSGNRLLLFARRPAPLALTYLGYADTAGLTAINYRLTDAFADPLGTTEHLHSERLLRLPHCFLCFRPHDPAPELSPLPALASGRITFGSFNALNKINAPLAELWARILQEVPGSRLRLKSRGLNDAPTRQRFLGLFGHAGIGPDRIDLLPGTGSLFDHLAGYHGVDIALDTYPYHGTTTTCEALWMGVPVITRIGPTHMSRVGGTILQNAALPELIAATPDAYVRTAIDLAGDLPRLSALRQLLRSRMQSSPLMNAADFTREVESAYREIWRWGCQSKTM